MAGFSQYHVRLQRDALNTPWGFRMQGGRDVGQPLSVQRVFSGTAAEGELQRGDLIVAIENKSTEKLSHKEAQDCIKAAGGSILLQIRRPPAGSVASPLSPQPKGAQTQFRPAQPKAMAFTPGHQPTVQKKGYGGGESRFGVDYSKRGPHHSPVRQTSEDSYMLNRVQHSLDNALLSPGGGRYDPELVITTPQYIPQKIAPDYYQSQEPVYQPPPSHQYKQQPQQIHITHHQQQRQPHQQQQHHHPQQQNQPSPQQKQPQDHPATEPFRPFKQQTIQVHYQQQQQQQQQSEPPQHYPPSQVADEEDEYQQMSVSERKKNFMKPDVSPKHIQPAMKRQAHNAPRITQQNRLVQFGVDYSRGHPPQPEPVHRPFASTPQPPTPEHPHTSPDVYVPGKPAWRGTLKKSGYKSWNEDIAVDASDAPEAPPVPKTAAKPSRSVQILPERNLPVQTTPASDTGRSIPVSHGRTRSMPIQKSWKSLGEPEAQPENTGPRVVHLQYNSPINVYSRDNVQETLVGQVGHVTPTKTVQKTPFGSEPRDWEQSAVYRMVHGVTKAPPPSQQTQPQPQHQRTFSQDIDEEVGVSDF